jgi:hypothetical protein
MTSIVLPDTADDSRWYLIGLMRAEGIVREKDEPSDEEVERCDKNREGKKGIQRRLYERYRSGSQNCEDD